MMTIRSEQCATCIYRPASPLRDNLPVLEDEIRDTRAPYHFRYARGRHSESRPSGETICAGFAERHGVNCTVVQLVRRLEAMRAVSPEAMSRSVWSSSLAYRR